MESKIVYYIMISNEKRLTKKSGLINDIDNLEDDILNGLDYIEIESLSLVNMHIIIKCEELFIEENKVIKSPYFSYKKSINLVCQEIKKKFNKEEEYIN